MKDLKYYLYRLKWRLAPYLNFSAPVHIDLELSTVCKLKCTFCFRQKYKYPQKYINTDLAIDIIKQAAEMGVKSIKFNWRGESIGHPDFGLIVDTAKEYGLRTMLNTSLHGIKDFEMISVLATSVDDLIVSMDSSVPEIYEKIRRGAKFDKVKNDMETISYWRATLGMSKIKLNRRTTKDSEPDEDFKTYWSDNYDFDIRPAMERNDSYIYVDGVKQERQRKYCGQPSRRMVIDVDGNVWGCCVAYAGQPELKLGNLNKNTLTQLWNTAELWTNGRRRNLIRDLKRDKMYWPVSCDECTSADSYK